MTNRLALILGGILVAAILLDLVANGGNAVMFMVRKFVTFVDYLEFWR